MRSSSRLGIHCTITLYKGNNSLETLYQQLVYTNVNENIEKTCMHIFVHRRIITNKAVTINYKYQK